jgi:putative transposase
MASPALLRGRCSEPGAFYVVTTVALGRRPLFIAPTLAQCVVDAFLDCEAEGRIETLVRVVMPDHVHWLIRLRDASLSRCVQAFKSRSARAINAARQGSGPVWQAGFHDHRLRDGEDLRAQARYIAFNPVRRGLVATPAEYPFFWCRWAMDGAGWS